MAKESAVSDMLVRTGGYAEDDVLVSVIPQESCRPKKPGKALWHLRNTLRSRVVGSAVLFDDEIDWTDIHWYAAKW